MPSIVMCEVEEGMGDVIHLKLDGEEKQHWPCNEGAGRAKGSVSVHHGIGI